MKLTAADLMNLGVVEQIIEEPEMLNINTFSEVTNVMEQKIYRFWKKNRRKQALN